MEHRAAVAFVEARDCGKIVDDAGRDEEEPGRLVAAVSKRHMKTVVQLADLRHADRSELDAVLFELAASQLVEGRPARYRHASGIHAGRCDRWFRGWPRSQSSTRAPAAAEHERGTEPCGPAADHDHLEHFHLDFIRLYEHL